MTEIRWATASDIDSFYGKRPPQTVRALVILLDGVPVAVGGLSRESIGIAAFMDLKPAARPHKKALLRAMKLGMEALVAESKTPVFAIADPNEQTAKGLLEHFGFVQIKDEVFEWRS